MENTDPDNPSLNVFTYVNFQIVHQTRYCLNYFFDHQTDVLKIISFSNGVK